MAVFLPPIVTATRSNEVGGAPPEKSDAAQLRVLAARSAPKIDTHDPAARPDAPLAALATPVMRGWAASPAAAASQKTAINARRIDPPSKKTYKAYLEQKL